MRSDKKDIRKVRLNNLIFGTSTVTTVCLYYGLRLGNVIYHSEQEIGLFEAMASSVETIFAQPLALFPSDWGSVLIFLTVWAEGTQMKSYNVKPSDMTPSDQSMTSETEEKLQKETVPELQNTRLLDSLKIENTTHHF